MSEHEHEDQSQNLCPACQNRRTVGNLNGPWRIAFKVTISTILPSILGLLVFLVPSVLKNNEARAAGSRWTEADAKEAHAEIEKNFERHKAETLRDILASRREIDTKLDEIKKSVDTLAGAMHRHLGEGK